MGDSSVTSRIGSRVGRLPAGRRSKWLFILLWIVVAVVVTPLAAQLTGAQTNDASAFLSSDAESTRALDAQRRLPGGDAIPAVVVFSRAGGLTDADHTAVQDARRKLDEFAASAIPEPIPAPDGRAVLLTILMSQNTDANKFSADIKEMRKILHADAPAGLDVALSGPAGLITDTYDLFSQIEGALLAVTVSIVGLILLAVYRSPVLWLVPLASVVVADQTASGIVYLFAKYADLTVNGQSAGILRVLVFGAGTDYALLLVARYREELARHADTHEAMRIAIRRAGPTIFVSAGTVIIALLCLLLGELNSGRGLGPVGAIGIASAFVTMMTLLPAAMLACGRRLFWPFIPRHSASTTTDMEAQVGVEAGRETENASAPPEDSRTGAGGGGGGGGGSGAGAWSRIGIMIDRHPRSVWVVTVAALGVLAVTMLNLNTGLRQDQGFREKVESVTGQQLVAASFPPGATAPTYIVANVEHADDVGATIKATPGVVTAVESTRGADLVQFLVVLDDAPDTPASFDTVERLRDRLHTVNGADALVGGNTAVNLDIRNASIRDQQVVIPVVLVVVVVILGLLLRSVVAPLILIATVVLSFFSALGASALTFDWIFDFPGADPSLPLYGFIFLVALGIDYNIFLMTRVREETERIGHRAGVLRGLAVTGGVITSAGVVLAATFSVLFVFPLVQLAEVGFLVAFGVLLDTLVVRSILVPALALDVGPRLWWPGNVGSGSRLAIPGLDGQRPGTRPGTA
jgi:RND superfamily putative drug exporter